jgi:protein SCO1/2
MAETRPRPNDDGRRIPRAGWALGLVLAAAIGSGVGIGLARNSPSPATPAAPADLQAQVTWAPGTKAASNFAFKDQNGRLVSLRSVRGRPVLLTFLDSRCKAQCPIEGRILGEVGRRLDRPLRPVLMVVSIDPWADTPASARAFTGESRWSGRWHWLFGTKATLAPIWRSYGIGVKPAGGDIGHSTALYLIDGRGDMRAGYLFPFSAATVARDARALAAGA